MHSHCSTPPHLYLVVGQSGSGEVKLLARDLAKLVLQNGHADLVFNTVLAGLEALLRQSGLSPEMIQPRLECLPGFCYKARIHGRIQMEASGFIDNYCVGGNSPPMRGPLQDN